MTRIQRGGNSSQGRVCNAMPICLRWLRRLAGASLLGLTVAGASLAADSIARHPIHFAKGTSSAKVSGSLAGDQTVDYSVRARAGQTMSVAMTTDSSANYFNVMQPHSDGTALFVGSINGNEWSGTLPDDGEYTIRVYLMRSAARRNESARYTLSTTITGTAKGSAPADARPYDAKVAGTPYHATGTVPCSMGDAAPGSAQCEFGVIRKGAGQAEVHVTPPGGFQRVLHFEGNSVTTDGEDAIKVSRSEDNWVIQVNDYEIYRIPDAVIEGG